MSMALNAAGSRICKVGCTERRIHVARSTCYARLKNPRLAWQAAAEATKAGPQTARNWICMMNAERSLNNKTQALAAAERAAALDADAAHALPGLRAVLGRSGTPET